tara:strand:- start:22110 stop:22970 length:861 start_codon:yes stop_codon:yes gene_type:complete
MDYSIKKFDAYHKQSRKSALTSQEANQKLGCKFTNLSSDIQKAFLEYSKHYNKIIQEENCAPGEPIQQRILSIKHFLKKQNLLKSETTKMFIGTHGNTQASKDVNNLRRLALQELEEDKKEFLEAVPLNLKPVNNNLNTKFDKTTEQKIVSSRFIKELKGVTSTLDNEQKKIWNASLYFVPKDIAFDKLTKSEQQLENIKTIILAHSFENKEMVVDKLQQWKEFFDNPEKQKLAEDITITNRLNETIQVGQIAYSLKACTDLIEKRQSRNTNQAYFLPLANSRFIK